ncbi:amine oxidase [Aspergillus minisclerotigenes]|uniref:monoamine oxidase n=1 Tax=Aspergillus minisclerotigenes TaxID=656917 RepID=A0A5N6J9F0_9EURO|nr:amine oxidase [Aspergillus minisclerotigenes]
MFNVAIIGAGMSGLQAAFSAKQAGLSFCVIEARDRVGGKVWSIPLASGRGTADLGAAWINDELQPRITAYPIDKTAIVQVSENGRLEFTFGVIPDFPPEEKRNLEIIRDHIEAESEKKKAPKSEDDQASLDTYMVNLWVRAMHGVESTEESAVHFINYCRRNHGLLAARVDDHTSGNHLCLQGGTQDIARGIARLVGEQHIYTSHPVYNGKAFVAKKAIVSIPSYVCYVKPWWRVLGYNGFLFSHDGPICILRDSSIPEKNYYSLTCFVNGSVGAEWAKQDPHARRRAVLEQLAKHEPYSQGALSPIPAIGHYVKYQSVHGKPVGNIHFVGTEYSDHWKGYMEGALTSGAQGAEEVLRALKAPESRL